MGGCDAAEPGGAVPIETWGPAVWDALHALSFAYKATADEREGWGHVLRGLGLLLPCEDCMTHLRAELKVKGVAPGAAAPAAVLACQDSLSRWLWQFHHEVSTRKAQDAAGSAQFDDAAHLKMLKAAMPYEDVRRRHQTANGSCGMLHTVAHGTCVPKQAVFETALIVSLVAVVVTLALALRRCRSTCKLR